ncbi:MAG: hypothetical protein WA655_05010 [Candidatus Korobacteraceae bacterium]
MRRWYVPLTVLGLGGLGALLLSERGRTVLRRMVEGFRQAPEAWLDWNDSFEDELERIRTALKQIADSLDPHPEPGH